MQSPCEFSAGAIPRFAGAPIRLSAVADRPGILPLWQPAQVATGRKITQPFRVLRIGLGPRFGVVGRQGLSWPRHQWGVTHEPHSIPRNRKPDLSRPRPPRCPAQACNSCHHGRITFRQPELIGATEPEPKHWHRSAPAPVVRRERLADPPQRARRPRTALCITMR